VLTALVVRMQPAVYFSCVAQTFRQAWLAIVTVMFIVALAIS